ncbi:Lipase 2 [Cedecea lapagei]|uniref:Lipase 2 n=1 Tax=Cedecea lapagei TaxID=158823 RepID=A0A3S4K162_9ENTR|nr:alpha/beta hydrolase [Cedecea lapagei]VEB99715.1 Lipase 2 [Cedecea lapagei]
MLTLPLYEFVRQMRSDYRAMIPMAGEPDVIKKLETRKITLSAGRRIEVRLYTPTNASQQGKLPAILFAHGGGWVSGDLDTHDVLARAMANGTGAMVVSVAYRLAPEYPAPCGIEDVYGALLWIYGNAVTLGIDNQRIAVAGDSAGGNIAAVVSRLANDNQAVTIRAQWLMYPVADLDLTTNSFSQYGETNFPTLEVMKNVMACYIPRGMELDDPLLSPAHAKLAGLPPTLVSVGSYDPLADGCIAYVDALQKAGVEASIRIFEKQQHGFIQFFKDKTSHPEGEAALKEGLAFLKEYL